MFSSVRSFLDFVFRRSRLEQEMEEEFRSHLRNRADDLERQGLSRPEAERQARIEFGGYQGYKEECREALSTRLLGELVADARYGLRQIRRNPAFSAAAIMIAALGIGAACVVLSFAEAAVIRALPYKDPAGLVSITMTDARFSHAWDEVPVPVFLSWAARAKRIGRFGASERRTGETLAGVPEPVQVFDYAVSPNALLSLGVRPMLGRGFLPSDYNSGAPPVVLLSYSLWQRLFPGPPDAVGRRITLQGVTHTILGVMPPGFTTPETTHWESVCWTPLIFNAKQSSGSLSVWGRLHVPPSRAQAALSMLALEVMRAHPSDAGAKWRITVTPLTQQVITDWRSILIILFGAAGFVLAISCANVANLLLGRANSRQKEIAVRAAVGASRARILRQLLTESVILGGLGGALGILLAHGGIQWESSIFPRALRAANFEQMGIDWRVLAATLAISLLVGIVFGLAPAIHASKVNLTGSLKDGSASAAPRRGRLSAQRILVVAEVALSLVLLTGAGLMLRSFLKLEAVNPGINPQQVLTMRVLLPKYRYRNSSDQIAAYQRLIQRIKSVPGIEASGFISPLPLDGIDGTFRDTADPGMSNVDPGGTITGGLHAVSPGYFRAMDIPLLDGRDFTGQDTEGSPRVMIVNKAFVDRYWLGRSPVGTGSKDGRVVGEVGNVRDFSLKTEPRPEVYIPFTQKLFAAFAGTVVVKTRTPAATATAMQKVIHSLDPEAPVSQIETMRQVLNGSMSDYRFYLILVGAFGLLALALAVAGIVSTVASGVSRRRHEIGIRIALGARRGDVLWLLARETTMLSLIGVACGIAGALALTRFAASQLYGISATDPATFAFVSLAFIGVSIVAGTIPALRATKLDSILALRHE